MAVVAIPEDQRLVQAQIQEAQQHIAALEERRREVDAQLAAREARRQQYALLDDICTSLAKLDELGASDLFWGEGNAERPPAERLAKLREDIAAFQQDLAAVQARRTELDEHIRREHARIELLSDELQELQLQEERRRDEYVIVREFVAPPFRPAAMPWSEPREDKNRLRKALSVSLLVTIGFAYLTSLWTISPPPTEVVEIPERIARLVREEPPPPVARVEEPKPQEPTPEQPVEQPTEPQVAERVPRQEAPAPTPTERQAARQTAQSAGLLAFKSQLSELTQSAPHAQLGVDARISDAGDRRVGQPAPRALLTAQAQGGSGGIDTASLSRNVGAAGRQGGAVEFARVESAIGTSSGAGSAERPRSGSLTASRTDEEIQIVFDRYKAALYRIYNRELRRDPTLRGKMVLRITIEPDGTVSACTVESTDMNSPTLVSEIVDRVKRFNFGPKEGVPALTILYPIDFLPAS